MASTTQKPDITFQLVHSLSRNEKRYFKLFSGLVKGQKNYLEIFEIMEKQQVYDEEALKKKLAKKPYAKQLTYEKHYLRKMILKALRSYHSSDESRLGNVISDLETLTEKGLSELFLPLVSKHKTRTLQQDTLAEYILLSRYELRFAGNMQMTDWFISHMGKGFKDDMVHIDNYKHALFILAKYNELNLVEAKYRFTDKKQFYNRIQQITDDPIFEGLFEKLPLKAQMTYFNFFSQYYAVQYQFEASYEITNRQMAFIQEHRLSPAQIGLFNYPVILMRRIESLRRLEKYAESIEVCGELYQCLQSQAYDKAKALKDQFLVVYLDAMLNNLCLTGNFKACLDFYKQQQTALSTLAEIGGVNLQIATHYYKAVSYFGLGDYNKVLDELLPVFELEKLTPFAYQVYPSRVIYMLAHVELGNSTYCLHYLRSFKRYFEKIQTETGTIDLIVKVIREYITNAHLKHVLAKKYPVWKANLSRIKQDNFEKEFIISCQLENWLDNKFYKVSSSHL
jgi:hypothetical protein